MNTTNTQHISLAGWTLQYCASADAQTYCPETFKEFYNQRRRWITSTIANLQVLKLCAYSWKTISSIHGAMTLMTTQ